MKFLSLILALLLSVGVAVSQDKKPAAKKAVASEAVKKEKAKPAVKKTEKKAMKEEGCGGCGDECDEDKDMKKEKKDEAK